MFLRWSRCYHRAEFSLCHQFCMWYIFLPDGLSGQQILNRNGFNFEGTFYLLCECVIHIEGGNMSDLPSCFPKQLQMILLTASPVFNVRLCQVFWMSLQIFFFFTSGCAGCFLFVSLWFYLLFLFSSIGELWHKQTVFSLPTKTLRDKVSRKYCVITAWCSTCLRTTALAQAEGYHLFYRKRIRCHLLCNPGEKNFYCRPFSFKHPLINIVLFETFLNI